MNHSEKPSQRGRTREHRAKAIAGRVAPWISIATLLAVASLWDHPSPQDVAVRSVATLGSIVTMFHAHRARHYSLATLFAVLALLFNPLQPGFLFAGDWQRALLFACAIPFAALLPSRPVPQRI
jgi:hypothetical protein